MRLTRVEIERFRAVDHLSLDLHDSTVLIGEHNAAKSTVLDAIDACLGMMVQDPILGVDEADFPQNHVGGELAGAPGPRTLAIALTVEESSPGEWKGTPLDPLARNPRPGIPRQVRLRAQAALGESGTITRTVTNGDRPREQGGPAVLAAWRALRAGMPALHLRTDRFFGAGSAEFGPGEADGRESQMVRTFRTLCSAQGRVSTRDLTAAVREAESLLESLPAHLLREPSERRRSLETIDRPRSALARLAGGVGGYRPGTGAQAAGVFLLLAMFLEARGTQKIQEGTFPIVLIEEPEAHLHPIVASMIWGVLEGLRAQLVSTTYSSEIVAATPLQSLRRMVRRERSIEVRAVGEQTLKPDEVRRISYHVRVRRGGSMFARAWVLIEGETEGWLLPELALLCGHSLPAEGVECIEFAQCGIEPLVKTADALGIGWHLIADGDAAGRTYAAATRALLAGRSDRERLTVIRARDIEEFLFKSGYASVYRGAAGLTGHAPERPERARSVIARAIKATSKPQMALRVVEAMAKPDSPGVPPQLREMIDHVVAMARSGVAEKR